MEILESSASIGVTNGTTSESVVQAEKTEPTEEILSVLSKITTHNSSQTTASISATVENSNESEQPKSAQPQATPTDEQTPSSRPTDADSWLTFIEEAEESGDFERTKDAYEALLETYPNTSSAQIAYINYVLESPNSNKFQHVVTLFNKFLKTSPFVDLWKFYLSYVRKMNAGPNSRDTIRKAYEYALNHIGHDKDSSEIWMDYIQFLKAGEAANPWDEGQKMDAIRKAYQRAVQTPIDNVSRVWEDYQEFENNLSKITAKKYLSDLQASHMQARTVLHTLQQEHLSFLFPPPPPAKAGRPAIWLPRPPTFNSGDRALVGRWRKYLKWEEGNPLAIDEKDKTQLHTRIQSVYRKAVVRMRFFPEIWFMAFYWTSSLGDDQGLTENKRKEKKDEAYNILKSGIEANPDSFVLNFKYAEVLEINGKLPEVHEVYKKFLDVQRQNLEKLDAEIAANSANTSLDSNLPPGISTPVGSQPQSQGSSQNTSFSSQSSDGPPSRSKELAEQRTHYGGTWIWYMRFARRAETLQLARQIFGRARRDKWTPWEVYEAAALMEYHCTKATDVATRIFEKGLENFPDEVEFALRYLGFLISINDDTNARALFERVVTKFTPERARPIWDRWARFEYQFGNLEAALALERRLAETYPNDPPIKRFAERHKYLGADAIASHDLGFNKSSSTTTAAPRSNGNGLVRTATEQTLLAAMSASQQSQGVSGSSTKRQSSPDHRRREESRGGDYGPPSKRQRPGSPGRDREREHRADRDRWDAPPRRRYGSPGWDREERDRRGRVPEREREEERGVTLPPILQWFVGQLPSPQAFDGPVFRTDDLMQVFRNAIIPSSSSIRTQSPVPSGRPGGRPPPDYSPYQGPGGGRRGRY
ncbi:mRNA 3'-end-processing protein RNA14 [Abortiporus biennis]